ncbi:MAG: beta-lactamase [Frankiales bacterium]|nr:beta-lactamase [Frankiales bacterium]
MSLESLFAAAGVDASFHAVDLDTGRQVEHHPDTASITASVFKLPVLIELCRQAEEGEIDASTPITVPVEGRANGPNGLSVMKDPLTASLRDLAWLMMGISDNAATDFILDQVGVDKVMANLVRLGITSTRVDGGCGFLFKTFLEDLGLDSVEGLKPTREMLDSLRGIDPARSAHVSTPRDMTTLLGLIWDDKAASPEACAEARRILGLQVWPHRLASGFADLDEVTTSGKTGTLPTIRNEVGVVEYPDGGRYAVACFTRAHSLSFKHAPADAVIGAAARFAVDQLRGAQA